MITVSAATLRALTFKESFPSRKKKKFKIILKFSLKRKKKLKIVLKFSFKRKKKYKIVL
jgi:hypothetical protein